MLVHVLGDLCHQRGVVCYETSLARRQRSNSLVGFYTIYHIVSTAQFLPFSNCKEIFVFNISLQKLVLQIIITYHW